MNKYKITVKFDKDEAREAFSRFLTGAWSEIAAYLKQDLQQHGMESDPSVDHDADKDIFSVSVESRNKGFVLTSKKAGSLETVDYETLGIDDKYSLFNRARGLDIFIKKETVDEFVGAAPTIDILTKELFGLEVPKEKVPAIEDAEIVHDQLDNPVVPKGNRPNVEHKTRPDQILEEGKAVMEVTK